MKLLLLVNSIHPGGAENFAFYLIKYLKRDYQYDISVAYIRDIESRSGEYNFKELKKEFPLYWLGKKHNSGFRGLFSSFRKLKKLCNTSKFDIILSACELPDLFNAWLNAGSIKVRTIQNAFLWPQKTWLGKIFEPYIGVKLDYHIAVSESVKKNWESKYLADRSKPIAVIPNGVHEIFYQIKKERIITPEQTIKLGAVARLEPQKGHIYLLQAIKELKGKVPVVLGIVGSGTLEQELKEYVRNNDLEDVVHFHGWYNRDEVYAFYESIDVLVMSSLYEGLPLNGIEAMATGLPVIGSRVPGIVDFLNEENGLLFESKNYKELAECIARISKDEKLYSYLSQKSRDEAGKYHFSTISKQYHDVFTWLLGPNSPGKK